MPIRIRHHKYNISEAGRRTWRGKTYASMAEMRYAQMLFEMLREGKIAEVVEQPSVNLGTDPVIRYRPDFLVVPASERPYYVDVKGHETREFKRIRKLWATYGRLDLVITSPRGNGTFVLADTIEGPR